MAQTPQPQRRPPTFQERESALAAYEAWWELPIRVLGMLWLGLLVYELLLGTNTLLSVLLYIIWGLFILDFLARMALSTSRAAFLRANVLTLISLAVPALRIFGALSSLRLLRLAPAVRGMRLITLVGSLNRGMAVLRQFLGWHHTGYVIVLSAIVTFVGAAGMYAFEHEYPGSQGFATYADCLWWTAMIMTTIASQAWPASPEGRFLCFLLSLYAFGVFGYITAALASLLVGRSGGR